MTAAGKRRFDHLAGSLVLLLISSIIALGLAEYAFRTIKEVQWRIAAKRWQHELYAVLPDTKELSVEGDGHPNGSAFAKTAQVLAPLIYASLGVTELR